MRNLITGIIVGIILATTGSATADTAQPAPATVTQPWPLHGTTCHPTRTVERYRYNQHPRLIIRLGNYTCVKYWPRRINWRHTR